MPQVQFNAEVCFKFSVLGRAEVFTPLLDKPLEGLVYLRSSGFQRQLPDLVADLRGQFRIILVGYIDSAKGRIRTRFMSVPDAPVSKFVLEMFGGKKGLLVNSRNLCKSKQRAKVSFVGQNGKRYDTRPVLKTDCKKKGKKRKSAKRHARG